MAEQKMLETGRWRPFVLAGPSGVGKGTLIDRLRKEFPQYFGKCITHTTRAPRAGEENGKNYHFTTRELFDADWSAGKFVERATNHNNYYGTSVAAIEAVASQNKICILDIDVQGCESVKKAGLNPFCIFLTAPSMDILRKRLVGRGTETPEQIQTRMETAEKELLWKDKANFWDHVLLNDDFEKCYHDLKKLIETAYQVQL